MRLRPYQQTLFNDVIVEWQNGNRNVIAVLCTGGGKTVVFSKIIHEHQGASCAIAHRQELVGQISLALAREEMRHRIIGPKEVIKSCIQMHIEELGRDYYDPSAQCAVAGVDTLVSWLKEGNKNRESLLRWAQQVTLWVCDEVHHLSGVSDPTDFSTGNKWAKAVSLFPNARGLGVTATPERCDGKGLGRGQDGVFDAMVVGPTMRELIDQGHLTEYRVFCPPSDLDLSTVNTGSDGDFVRGQLAATTRKSSVMGDVLSHYMRIAPGKLGVTFAPDVETASELVKRFMEAGIPAEVVSAKTPDRTRREIIRQFRQRKVLQLVNVEIFSEGFDLPAIEVVSDASATQSYSRYAQRFGRMLRPLDGKLHGIYIDHVGNVLRHGLPDRPRTWSLDRRERRSRSVTDPDVIPMRICTNPECMAPYEAVHPACPFCGMAPTAARRSAPEYVDGDLYELDAATLAAMRGEVERVDRPADEVYRAMRAVGHPEIVARSAAKRHVERQRAQGYLKEAIGLWAGYRTQAGDTEQMAYRRFYHSFGTDVLSAQALGRAEADTLTLRLYADIGRGIRV